MPPASLTPLSPGEHQPGNRAALRIADLRGSHSGKSMHDGATWVDEAMAPNVRRRAGLTATRTRKLVLFGLIGASLLVLWLRMMAAQPMIDASFRLSPLGHPMLIATNEPALQASLGQVLQAIVLTDGTVLPVGRELTPRSPRWVVNDTERERRLAWRDGLSQALQQPQLTLLFDAGVHVVVVPRARGLAGLGVACWLFSALALVLYLAAAAVLPSRPVQSAWLYGLMALAQALNLLLIGADAMPGLGASIDPARLDLALRVLADTVAAASLVHVLALYPVRLPQWPWVAAGAWLVALPTAALALLLPTPGLWWLVQALMAGCGAAAVLVLRAVMRRGRNPLPAMLTRLAWVGIGTLVLASLAIALAEQAGLRQDGVAQAGAMVWQVFFASLLMLAPFLTRSRQVVREFAALAGISTVAISLDLLLVTVLGFGQLAAITLALAVSLLLYVGARHWMLRHLAGSGGLSAERMFESLYRAARAIEQAPEHAAEQLGTLMREVFDPLELARVSRHTSRIRVAPDGSTLVVPIPQLSADGERAGTLVLRFAHRGRHLFTLEDMRLTERIIEQLRRAVAYDRAVEHGRSEERTRIAQDLHDDIGARLLTLMYKAQDPDIEEYIRHTLQDLKTLTRGLAASNHRLSHAAAEWKADMTQRLAATGCDLHWSFSADRDITLNVVQWSGITRVLRELVNNIITHAQATQVEVSLQFDRGRLSLVVSDDGIGRTPERWSHGLGLGGVRKRVKLLGGQVAWRERETRGIRCEMHAMLVGERG